MDADGVERVADGDPEHARPHPSGVAVGERRQVGVDLLERRARDGVGQRGLSEQVEGQASHGPLVVLERAGEPRSGVGIGPRPLDRTPQVVEGGGRARHSPATSVTSLDHACSMPSRMAGRTRRVAHWASGSGIQKPMSTVAS